MDRETFINSYFLHQIPSMFQLFIWPFIEVGNVYNPEKCVVVGLVRYIVTGTNQSVTLCGLD